jgi:outer membrane autotransporter protein
VAVLDRASTADVKDTHYGAYVRLRFGKLAVDGGYGHSARKFTTNRTVAIGALSENAQANYDLDVDQGFARVSLRFPVKRLTIEPVVGAASISLGAVSASEVAASAGLSVNAQAKSYVVGEAGVRLRADLGGKGGNAFTLTGSALRRHANVAETVRVTNALTSGAGFEVASQAALADAWLINAGVEAKLGKRVNLSIAYAGVKGDGIESSGGKANLSIRF